MDIRAEGRKVSFLPFQFCLGRHLGSLYYCKAVKFFGVIVIFLGMINVNSCTSIKPLKDSVLQGHRTNKQSGEFKGPLAVSFRTLEEGPFLHASLRVGQPQLLVLEDKADIERLLSQIPIEAGKIDSNHEVLLGFFLGSKPTGGYRVIIREILVQPGRVDVIVWVKEPGSDEYVSTGSTDPHHLIAVKKHDLQKAKPRGERVFWIVQSTDGRRLFEMTR